MLQQFASCDAMLRNELEHAHYNINCKWIATPEHLICVDRSNIDC